MADGLSWSEMRDSRSYRLPGPDRLGWWAAVAMIASLLLHVVVFFALDHFEIALKFSEPRELATGPIHVQQVEVRPFEPTEAMPPEEAVIPPNDSASLLEEVDLLELLPKDQEIDIRPDALEAEYALTMERPTMEGDPTASAIEISQGVELAADLPEFGREVETLRPAEIGQITVDPGLASADDLDLGKFTEDLIKRGANGKADRGAMDGITSLDDLIDLPPNLVIGKKTLLPSDLLFEFNSADLRESAKVGLMKLGLLIDRNPSLYCWIEGHADLVGSDDFNLQLSKKRADAVREYLVKSMRMDGDRIITRGFGRAKPLVPGGTVDEQAGNRRVEIRMRKTPPTDEPVSPASRKAPVVEEEPEVSPPPVATPVQVEEAAPVAPLVVEETPPPPPRAVLVKPKRALPVAEDIARRAAPRPPRATPVREAAPRATPVAEPEELSPVPPVAVPRAEAVEE